MICTTVNSQVNISELQNLNKPNSDNVIGTYNLTHIIVQKDSPFNTVTTLQNMTTTESSVSINDEIIDENNISEEISSHQNSAVTIYRICAENIINLINT